MLTVVLLDEILENRPRLEKSYFGTVLKGVRQCWNSAIGINFEKPRFFLDICRDIEVLSLVRLRASQSSHIAVAIVILDPALQGLSRS